MSLLMKALEKAAKDRGEAQPQQPATESPAAGTAAAATAAKSPKLELTLEPLQADAPAASEEPPAAPPPPPRSAAQTRTERNQARAATVMQATARPAAAAAPASRFRISPVMALGLVGGLAALGFAIYVYLQITNPGLFIRRPPASAQPPAPLAQPAAPAQAPIATGTIIAPASPAEQRAAAATPRVQPEAPPRQPAPVAAAPKPETPAQPANRIQISAGSAEPQVDNRLMQAYAALQSGRTGDARQLYGDAVRSDPRSINALLGLAAVALQEGNTDEAGRLYMGVLELEPRNAYAQTGLIGMMGRADPLASETRLKQLIARGPSAALHFTLGNLYGDQSRWPEAQQAYFQAHQLEPSNPDYTYNLAVSLEHIGQPKLAANFYRQAVDQAQARGRAGFNLAQAQDRVRQLAAQQ
ncbi:MAG: tetratricopeptide repeat protein [Burkholderiales bacterium]|nr:tetratricopeptide repeat protein [Burkholderiales bacterium]